MRDRTHFFRSQYEDEVLLKDEVLLEVQEPEDSSGDEVKTFLKQVLQIRNNITQIERVVEHIREHHAEIYGTAAYKEKLHNQLNQAMDEIQNLFDTVKLALNTMKQYSEAILSEEGAQDHRTADVRIVSTHYNSHRTADVRIVRTHYNSLQSWFYETWTEYHQCQSDYRDRCKEMITRQIQIADKEIPQQEIDSMLESGKFTVFSFDVQFQEDDIEELKSRHEDVTKLADSLKHLHDMFKDLAQYVESQGQMLDSIEKNANEAGEYVRRSGSMLPAIVVISNRKRKLICAAIVILAIILVIIMIKLLS